MISLEDVCKYYGDRAVFDHVSWSMSDDARVGLVGLNGAGKTTLLRMIAGIIDPDSGRISRPQRTRAGYLAQDSPEIGGRPLIDETLSALGEISAANERRLELERILAQESSGPRHDAALTELGEVLSELERHDFYTAESRAEAVLFGLGFTTADLKRDVAEFSGGIRMRIALAKLLLQKPEFMMLDEPTNHLDIEARNWLEDYLSSYPGGLIVVSHDRYFLDRVTRRTLEVARGKLIEYTGNYSAYLVKREERFATEMAAYENQREELEHIEAFISRFRYQASKAKLVQSRIKQLEKIERLDPPAGADRPPSINFPQAQRSGRRVLELHGAVKRYGDLVVYDGIDLVIERGAKIALVGPNGAGKSTLIKLLAGIEPLTAGQCAVGHNVSLAYFAQDLSESLDYDKSVFDELHDNCEGMTTPEARNLLAAMLFSGDDVRKRTGVLSGGERSRLALAKVLARRSNCLLLDEPTNNLDIIAKDSLLDALQRYQGTVIIVSHDRYVLNELVGQVYEVGQGHATLYLGNYDDYLLKKEQEQIAASIPPPPVVATQPAKREPHGAEQTANGKVRPQVDREAQRRQERDKKRRRELEERIEAMEAQRASLGEEMNNPNFYLQRKDANQMIARYESLAREIERLYDDLMKLDGAAAQNA
ncbi:MAG TPA: ABC-F family ATP-binding cassette domain-containing protein [Candidatus Binataceae bacterium]|nr:ABC-F family ATP-binding cassette domain-containing protein [Candidatus Binataceae bacterium]